MADVDVVVAGAGVVGLACAASLARHGRSVVVVEPHEGPGRETSSRNSGVIHAGLYYPEGSLKAETCVEGRRMLYERCRREGIPHRRTGKLVIATEDAEVPVLERLLALGAASGAPGLRLLDAAELRRREPLLRGVAALLSPDTGIVDAHALVASYLAEARAHGAQGAWRTRVVAAEPRPGGVRVHTASDRGEPFVLEARWMVNAAGLGADSLAAACGLDVDALGLRQHPCKGDYFALAGSAPRPGIPLVYPVPGVAGIGVHLTVDLGGRCVAGPDASYVDRVDYGVDPGKAVAFAEAVARYLPGVRAEHLSPDYAGVRPKLQPPGGAPRDFAIVDGAGAGAPRTVHLVGIESPGLTAAGALAERVRRLLDAD